jgi:DNA-binding NarL/FixJ family response regulator
MIRILIADDHEVVREGLRRFIEAQPDWHVVAEASDGKEAIRQAVMTNPDVAVLDIWMPLIKRHRGNQANPGAATQHRSLDLHSAGR